MCPQPLKVGDTSLLLPPGAENLVKPLGFDHAKLVLLATLCLFVINTDPCERQPCWNGGVCIPEWTSSTSVTYKCSCGGQFSGAHCEFGNIDQISFGRLCSNNIVIIYSNNIEQ